MNARLAWLFEARPAFQRPNYVDIAEALQVAGLSP
jgi:hypothetical protein